jgi:hypothetical protein
VNDDFLNGIDPTDVMEADAIANFSAWLDRFVGPDGDDVPLSSMPWPTVKALEARDRREWIEGVKQRLGMVTIGDAPRPAVEWPAGLPDGDWEVISDHTLELPLGWPEGCRCVISDGQQVSLGGPCQAHSERPE